jgi:hypothetical protein
MSDLLAIVGPPEMDDQLLRELARRHPDRVTVLMDEAQAGRRDPDGAPAAPTRDRLARLLHAIERRTGAVVVGLAGSREQLRGWRFDRIVGGDSGRLLAGRG